MTGYEKCTSLPSKSSFLLPFWFIRPHFSKNFNWLTVNFPICSSLTLVPGIWRISSRQRSTCSTCSSAMLSWITREGYLASLACNFRFFLESEYYEESVAFRFSRRSQISAMVGDYSRHMKTQFCSVGDVRGCTSLITNPLLLDSIFRQIQ